MTTHRTKILIPIITIILTSVFPAAQVLPDVASDQTFYESEHYCVVIYPDSRLLSRPETGAEVLYEPQLWDIAFVIKSSRNAWKNVPVENEHQRIACERVFFPSGETGWIKSTHIMWSESQPQLLGGWIARDNTSLYNQLPDGVEKGHAKANTRFDIKKIKLLKSAETTADAIYTAPADILCFKVSFHRTSSDGIPIREAWVHGKDIHIAFHDALIGAGRELMQKWRDWKEDHTIGGAELLYRHILEKYPRQKYYDWEYDAVAGGVFCGIIALDSLADIYILNNKYEKAVAFLNRIIEEYPGTTGTISRVMEDWAATGPADGLALLKMVKITAEYQKNPLKAMHLLQEITSKHGDLEIFGFEWNTSLGLEALARMENIGKEAKLADEFMSEQFHQAVLSSDSPFVQLLGTIKHSGYLRKAGRSKEAAENLSQMIHKHPTASMVFFKSTADFSVSALDLLCRIFALDLADPIKAQEICREIFSRYKEAEDCYLDGAASYLKAEILDKTDGTRENVISAYNEALRLAEYEDVISVIRSAGETEGYVGRYAAQLRIKAIEAFAPLSKKTQAEIPVFHYPDTGAKVLATINKGDPVTVLYKRGDLWYKAVSPNGTVGWAEKSRIDPPLPPSASYSEWKTHGKNNLRQRSIEAKNTIKQPNAKLALENIAAKEVLFFDVNKDGSPDLVFAGMNDRERATQADYHNITVIDGITEKILWEFETNDSFSFHPPAIMDKTLYVLSDFGQAMALDIYTGELKWRQKIESGMEPTQPTTVSTKLFLFIGQWSDLFVLSREEGFLVERIKTDYSLSTSFFSFEDGRLYCGASGKSPLLDVKDRSAFICIDTHSFEILWIYPLETKYVRSSPLITDDLVIAGAGDGVIYALNKQNGTLTWTFETGGPITSSPAFRNNIVCIGSEDGSFYAIESGSGSLLWKFESAKKFTASPCIVGDVVYAGSNDGYLYALNLDDGKLLWKYQIGYEIKNNLSSNGPVVAVPAGYQQLYLIGKR